MCRSRREISNEYLLDEISVDTAENESNVTIVNFLFVPLRYLQFLKIVRSTAAAAAAAAENDPCKVFPLSVHKLSLQIAQVYGAAVRWLRARQPPADAETTLAMLRLVRYPP